MRPKTYMNKRYVTGLVFAGIAIILQTVAPHSAVAFETQTATFDKTSINIYARRRTGTYEEMEKRGYAMWGWTPQIDLRVNGPISATSVLSIEFTKPDGRPWVKFNCETGETAVGRWWQVRSCGEDLPEDVLAREIGLYGFKISLKDEINASRETTFVGKVKIGRFFAGGNQASEKEHYGYYVDYDWRLPIGQVYAMEPEDDHGQEYAPLAASFWFRGDVQGEVSAHLYYKGREISNTKDTTKGTWLGETTISSFDESKFNWKQQKFIFTNTLVFDREAEDNHPTSFRMDRNSGEYEIKVLRNGALVRTAKFTVGPNGSIVDNGISQQNSVGNNRMIVLATVSGDEAGAKPDLAAWKTTAFFGDALKGVSVY